MPFKYLLKEYPKHSDAALRFFSELVRDLKKLGFKPANGLFSGPRVENILEAAIDDDTGCACINLMGTSQRFNRSNQYEGPVLSITFNTLATSGNVVTIRDYDKGFIMCERSNALFKADIVSDITVKGTADITTTSYAAASEHITNWVVKHSTLRPQRGISKGQ